MQTVVVFEGPHWVITPAALALNEPSPASISDQKFTLVLTGVGIVDLTGTSSVDWRWETLLMLPSLGAAMNYAIDRYGIPRPPGPEGGVYQTHFQVENWAPFAGLSAIFDRHQSVDAGYAIDRWSANLFAGTDYFTGQRLTSLWGGFFADAAVRDSDAVIHRVSYHVTLTGRIRFRKAYTNLADDPDGPPPG
ncbi:MAG: hypothetical protein ACR2HV_08540 [Acidimicrobiales bacterium]